MTDTEAADEQLGPAPTAAEVAADERLVYRGVFQRLFIRPEIGALIGVVGLWIFFWIVSVPFGTAGGTASLVDFASSPLGIMAVAVSMLMVGGEFDLSAGAMTGAMGIVVILLSKEVGERGGAGLNLWLAIPLTLVIALAIGYWNGVLVERTKLPSFIITLGTFFILIGAKLGFSKLIVDQVQVGDIREGGGYDFWRTVFASEWQRNEHVWSARDSVFLVLILLAVAACVAAALVMQYDGRADGPSASGLPVLGAGLVAVVIGVVVLHQTDATGGNVLGSAIIGLGVIVAMVGLGRWRFAPVGDRGPASLPPDVVKWLGIGLAGFVVAVVVAAVMDPYDSEDLFFPFTHQGLRATLFLIFVGVWLTGTFVALSHARKIGVTVRSIVLGSLAVTLTIMAFFVQSQSESDKLRSQAFSFILAAAMLVAGWLVVGWLFRERDRVDHDADAVGTRLLIAGAVLGTIAMLVRLLYVVPDEIAAGITPARFSVRTFWFVLFTAVCVYVLGKTRFGSWTFAVGGNKEAARQVGVPAARTKTQLFMLVAGASWLVGMLLAFRLNTIQANTGNGEEFEYIIAAVVGGTLLTGGYGTALGGALGAVIIAQATLGIPSARWNSDWRFLFLGVTLLLAVLANRTIRTRAEAMRR